MQGEVSAQDRLPVVVLISGNGSNLQALIDATTSGALPIDIRAVISNRRKAFGLERAQRAGIHTEVLLPKDFDAREDYDAALMRRIDAHAPGLLVLAGFMRILSAEFVQHFAGRILNIHPSLLPKYRGLNPHRQVLEAGDAIHGASVHFVTEELDGGPVIVQGEVPVHDDDTEDTLAARVQAVEHVIYPQAVRLFAEGRIQMTPGGVVLDKQPLAKPLPAESVAHR
ncbi:MAG: phosphoribosylglycinamide formyltransferase [Gammaproteobacteria bacterium]|nr:phosphoribosylglycinamide formyltransferase [Gammaproteobacteria bacterium]